MVSVLVKDLWVPELIKTFSPKSGLGRYVMACLSYLKSDGSLHLPADAVAELLDRISRCLVLESRLSVSVLHRGRFHDLGLVSEKVITTAGVTYLVDAFQNLTALENFKFHGIGTGVGAEAIGETALVTELTTQYLVNSTRPTGTQTENGATIYRSVGDVVVDASVTTTEHGLFSQAAVPGGTLWDRSVVSPSVDLVSSDTFTATYDLTCSAGG